jgi:hypothetical protein
MVSTLDATQRIHAEVCRKVMEPPGNRPNMPSLLGRRLLLFAQRRRF